MKAKPFAIAENRNPNTVPAAGLCRCGGKKENLHAATCYGCHLASLLPPGYERSEEYAADPIWRHPNATRKPPTGLDILDRPSGPRIARMLLMCWHRPRVR